MQDPDSNDELSPEADKFLGDATAEFNARQEALNTDWGFDSYKRWDYDQFSGVLCLTFADGTQFRADGQFLGSYCAGDGTFEWAWNNPNVEHKLTKDSQLVRQLGEQLGIDYLQVGVIPIPDDAFVSYLSAIGIKATDSIGVFRGNAGPVDVLLLLKNPRK
jgi:hypothetical protein